MLKKKHEIEPLERFQQLSSIRIRGFIAYPVVIACACAFPLARMERVNKRERDSMLSSLHLIIR